MKVRIPVTAPQAALIWALGDRPVYAAVNGDYLRIRPIGDPEFDKRGDRSWNCRVLEDPEARFYVEVVR